MTIHKTDHLLDALPSDEINIPTHFEVSPDVVVYYRPYCEQWFYGFFYNGKAEFQEREITYKEAVDYFEKMLGNWEYRNLPIHMNVAEGFTKMFGVPTAFFAEDESLIFYSDAEDQWFRAYNFPPCIYIDDEISEKEAFELYQVVFNKLLLEL